MTKRKMINLCDKLKKANADWEASENNHSGQAREDAHSEKRMEIVGRWIWCTLMHLDALGYDIVKTNTSQKPTRPLIAAAPELLEALQSLVEVCPECDGTGVYFPRKDPITGHKEEAPCQWCKHARAAITKATGQEGHQ